MSCFNGTGIHLLLRNLGVIDVVIAGVWTNMAVEHTTRDAADHGYRTLLANRRHVELSATGSKRR